MNVAPHAPGRTTRTAAGVACPWPAHRLGRACPGPRRTRRLPGTDRRAARDRHQQPPTAAGREAPTKPRGGGNRRDSAPPPEERHPRAESSGSGNGLLGPERREHPAHEPLVSRAMLADVPLTGLSFAPSCCSQPDARDVPRRTRTDLHGSDPLARMRTGWDSNPRAAFATAGFQDRCIQPLCHPSRGRRAPEHRATAPILPPRPGRPRGGIFSPAAVRAGLL